MRNIANILTPLFMLFAPLAIAQEHNVIYKQVDQYELHLVIRTPDKQGDNSLVPAVIFYHGGGWIGGSPAAFAKQSSYLTQRGMVTVCVQYRLAIDGNTPRESLKDAKSALRYIKAHAAEYNIDPDRIILGGGSAGGHLAAATILCSKIYDESDDLSISTDASALVLFNPIICNGPERSGPWQGRGYEKVADYYKEISPMHNITDRIPPTLFMVGDRDELVPTAVAKEFTRLVEEAGSSCELHIYEGYEHSFFNIKGDDARGFYLTLSQLDNFLVEHGYLSGSECVGEWLQAQKKSDPEKDRSLKVSK